MEKPKEQILDKEPKEPESPVIFAENQEKLFARLEQINILPAEKREWSLDKLEQDLNGVFCDYGQAALEKNNGQIFLTLSGGLDSTLALAFLRSNFLEKEIITFSMGGSVNHPDILHARLAAKKFGSEHNEFIPTPDQIARAIEEHKEKAPKDNLAEVAKTGNLDVAMLYEYMAGFRPNVLLACDGIDELMGGYWDHRKITPKEEKEKIFADYWRELVPHHLIPLIKTGNDFGIGFLFPYLDQKVVESISDIPLEDRTSKEVSKKPLREIAKRLGVPAEILTRTKRGQVGMLDKE